MMLDEEEKLIKVFSLSKEEIKKEFQDCFKNQEFDIRISRNARWIDQKCTPDVICAVSDIIINITEKYPSKEFTTKDVWFSNYARKVVIDQFNKADSEKNTTKAEYNKFFQQQLNLLAYSGILNKDKKGRVNVYSVAERLLLFYISLGEKQTLLFLKLYIKEVLEKSNMLDKFKNFFEQQTENKFEQLKREFYEFSIRNTPINKKLECNRIFPKVLNPLAEGLHKKGAIRGRLSKDNILFNDLMYNKKNFRDIYSGKPKNVSRTEWLKENPIPKSKRCKFKSESIKAKRLVRLYNIEYFGQKPEIQDELATGKALQMHHIFPEHEKPEISGYTENIIALTPSQHFQKAHPNNDTMSINLQYQEQLLKAKAYIIDCSISQKKWSQIYSFDRFATVIRIGFNLDRPEKEYNNYTSALNEIEQYYKKIN